MPAFNANLFHLDFSSKKRAALHLSERHQVALMSCSKEEAWPEKNRHDAEL
jgi:hypothetical protein